MKREELDRLVDSGDGEALVAAMRDASIGAKLERRILARLYSTEPREKWRAVAALGCVAGEGGLGDDRLRRLLQRFTWALSDESGAVPYGIAEALGEVLARRPAFQREFAPLLVSYLVHEDLVQTGPILAGAIWALGRIGISEASERRRALPGLRTALAAGDAEVSGAALWTAARLDLAGALRPEIAGLTGRDDSVCLLVDGDIVESALGDLARNALGDKP